MWMLSKDAKTLVTCFLSLTNYKTDSFSSGRELTSTMITSRHPRFPFATALEREGGRRAEAGEYSSQDERARWRGKLSDYSRLDKELPSGWRRACNEEEKETGGGGDEGAFPPVNGVGLARDTPVCREWRSQSMLEGRTGWKAEPTDSHSRRPGRTLKHPPMRIQSQRSTK